MFRFGLGIPTLNRFDLLHPALLYYLNDFPNTQILVLDNGGQGISNKIDHPNITVVEPEYNLGVASSWNQLCSIIFNTCDNALILNDDIYLGRTEWEIQQLIDGFPADLYLSEQDWSAFIMPKQTFEKVGKFDEAFYPAYYEDNDYEYRMKLIGMQPTKLPFLNPVIFKRSGSMDKDKSIYNGYLSNEKLYVAKWGGMPNEEKYKTPFDR